MDSKNRQHLRGREKKHQWKQSIEREGVKEKEERKKREIMSRRKRKRKENKREKKSERERVPE